MVIGTAGTVVALTFRSVSAPPAAPQTIPTTSPAPTNATAAHPPEAPTPEQPKLDDADTAFIAELRRYGVPVSDKDPQFTIDMANAVCSLVHEQPQKYPPGTYTMLNFVDGVMGNNPSCSNQQATRFTNAAARHYCPDAWGPSQDEIAAMAPDAQFLAILQDRYGITPVGGGQSAIDAAPHICSWKSQGRTDDQVTDAINSNNTLEVEQAIVETAVRVYCPHYR